MNKIRNQIATKSEGTQFEFKIKQLAEANENSFVIQGGQMTKIDIDDDIKREQLFYKIAKSNLKHFKGSVSMERLDTKYMHRIVTGEVVYNDVVKHMVHLKNQEEKELNQQGKKIQQLIASKNTNQEKLEKLVEQVKKAMKHPPKEEEQYEIERQPKPNNMVHKKGIKKEKQKRKGKLARLHMRLKRNSRRQ